MIDQIEWDLKFRCPNCGVWHESDGVRDMMFGEVILCPCDHVIEVSYQVIATDAGHLPEVDDADETH